MTREVLGAWLRIEKSVHSTCSRKVCPLHVPDHTLAGVLHKSRFWHRINRRPVNERQRLVIDRMLSGFSGFLSTSKYATLAKCSPDTALRDIRELLERGILVQNPGGGRSTSYRLAGVEELEQE